MPYRSRQPLDRHRKIALERGSARASEVPVAQRHHRHDRRAQSPAGYRPADRRKRRRLRIGVQGESSRIARRYQPVARTSEMGLQREAFDRGRRPWPHRDAPAGSAPRWRRSRNVIDGRVWRAIGKVVRTRDIAGTATTETAYYLLSAALSPNDLAKSLVRIGVSKTGFTGFSMPSWTRTGREIVTITAHTTSPSAPHGAQPNAMGSVSGVAAQQIQSGCLEGRVIGRTAFADLKRRHKCQMWINFDTFCYQPTTRRLTRP